MNPSEDCLKIIRFYESFRSLAYKCPRGIWTYGYGFTTKADGFPVKSGDTISKEESEGLLIQKAKSFAAEIKGVLPGVEFSQNQLDGLTSFVFNIGITRFKGSSVYRLIKAGIMSDDKMQDLFLRWIFAAGDPLPGLVKRRLTESRLYLIGEVKFDWDPDLVKQIVDKNKKQ